MIQQQLLSRIVECYNRSMLMLYIQGQNSMCAVQALGWWEKNTASNMTEVKSTDQLVHSLLDAGDKLVIVEFFSPGCGSCRALHPKVKNTNKHHLTNIFLSIQDKENAKLNNFYFRKNENFKHQFEKKKVLLHY